MNALELGREAPMARSTSRPERWLITGASGRLGRWLVTVLRENLPAGQVLAFAHESHGVVAGVAFESVDLVDPLRWEPRVRDFAPSHIVHVGAVTSLAAALADPEYAYALNVAATEHLGRVAVSLGARFVLTSTDMVFDGTEAPYAESSVPRPLSVYGRSKVEAEQRVFSLSGAVVVRLALLVGPSPGHDEFEHFARALRAGESLTFFSDEYRTPLSYEDAARALVEIARRLDEPLVHLGGPERLSRLELGRRLASALGVPNASFLTARRATVPSAEPRPGDLSLDVGLVRRALPWVAPRPVGEQATAWAVPFGDPARGARERPRCDSGASPPAEGCGPAPSRL